MSMAPKTALGAFLCQVKLLLTALKSYHVHRVASGYALSSDMLLVHSVRSLA
jgi:hypothetical protein